MFDTFNLGDAVDVVIASVFIYGILFFVTRNSSRRSILFLLVIGLVFVVAQYWQMFLTLAIFRIGLVGVIIGFAIVHQDEIRAGVERVGRWVFGNGEKRNLKISLADKLAEVAFRLAETKTGALVVMKGRDSLSRLIDGGIELDATVSGPLLFSIFDSSSAGHDGAVIIESGRASRFAAHLPLAKTGRVTERGTRHHAALGLSDCCDALILVVSEERGQVSLARHGELTEVRDVGELAKALHQHRSYRQADERASSARALFTYDLWLKMAALAIAISAWAILADKSAEVYRTFLVPVEYRNVPENFQLSQALTEDVKVTLTGTEKSFKFLAPSAVVVSIDVAELSLGKQQFTVTEDSVRHPANLRVSAIEPRSLRVAVNSKNESLQSVTGPDE